MTCSDGNPLWVIPLRRKTKVVEVVGDELQVFEVDGLAPGELHVEQVVVVRADGGFW
jgi:hypothetical protein